MATTRDILMKVREDLTNPRHWTKGAVARDWVGTPLDAAWDPAGVAWCVSGAIWRRCHDIHPGMMETEASDRRLLSYLVQGDLIHTNAMERSLADFNDDPETHHRHILAAIDHTLDCLPPPEDAYA